MTEKLTDSVSEEFKLKRKKYVQDFTLRHKSLFRPYREAGTLGKTEEWRNVSEHCVTGAILCGLTAEALSLPPESQRSVEDAFILHDYDAKKEKLAIDRLRQEGNLTLESITAIKNESEERLRAARIPENIIKLTGANIPETEAGPQTDEEKIVWYVDMMLANTEPLPILERLEKGWDGKEYNSSKANRTTAFLNLFRDKFHGKHLNEVQRELAVTIGKEFTERIGYEGDPNNLPLVLKGKFEEKVNNYKSGFEL